MEPIRDRICAYLPEELRTYLNLLPEQDRLSVCEIRIRTGVPMVLLTSQGNRISTPVTVKSDQIKEIFRLLCGSSAYAFQRQIAEGFLTIPGGHRVGLTGTAVLDASGTVTGMREITGFVFRVRKMIDVNVEGIVARMKSFESCHGVVISGPPCSGKTTYLAALAKALSESDSVAVIDERRELFPDTASASLPCEVLWDYPKQIGILQALRTLSPHVIICDEVGTLAEAEAMTDGFCSGVSIVFSAHAGSVEELFSRPPVRLLAELGGVDLVIFLSRNPVGQICQILKREAIRNALGVSDGGVSVLCRQRSNVYSRFDST